MNSLIGSFFFHRVEKEKAQAAEQAKVSLVKFSLLKPLIFKAIIKLIHSNFTSSFFGIDDNV